jgi:hypothetical protein
MDPLLVLLLFYSGGGFGGVAEPVEPVELTAEQRRMASGVPLSALGPGVTPDDAKGEEWRAGIGWSFEIA